MGVNPKTSFPLKGHRIHIMEGGTKLEKRERGEVAVEGKGEGVWE